MSRRTIQTDRAPAAIGPYSQGALGNGLLFTSMQIGLDPESGELVGETAAQQVRQCLGNLRAIVEAAGAAMKDVLQVRVYLTDMKEFAAVNEVYAEWFPADLPARAVVGVASLPKSARVAVEIVADATGVAAE